MTSAISATIAATSTSTTVPPLPPRHYFEPSLPQTLLYLCYGLLLAIGPGWLSYVVQTTDWPLLVRLPASLLLSVIAGYGFFMLAGTAHEGFHFNLHRRPVVSGLIGIMFSACIPGFIGIGFTLSHWKHHQYTNQLLDPDCMQFGRFHSFWSRLLLARLSANAAYRRVALTLLTGRIDSEVSTNGLPLRTLRWLCLVNVVWHLLLMVGLIAICISAPLFAVCLFVAPLIATVMITGLNPYQEHAGTGTEHDTKARSRTSPLFTVLMFGTNYHLEHHLYPRVPCWRLPALHRWLVSTDWYRASDPIVVSQFIAAFSPRLLSGAQVYGEPVP
jgi:beta-carotene hydroxylase